MTKEYDVGYRCPPKASQFKKGQSGNPQGRPKGSLSVKHQLRKALLENTPVKTDSGTIEMPAVNVLVKKCLYEVGKGNMKAAEILSDLVKFEITMTPENDNDEEAFTDEDILQAHDQRVMARAMKGGELER